MLLVSIIWLLLVSVANGIRNCNDCTAITQCREVLELVDSDKSEATADRVIKAKCGHMKVCCSDFSVNPLPAVEDQRMSKDDNESSNEDGIENHPNAYLLPDECGEIRRTRIIGGPIAEKNEFPWIALIVVKFNQIYHFTCAGTVINERYVLTAAHCLERKTIAGVRIGEYDVTSRTDCSGNDISRTCQNKVQDIRVSKIIMHPDYLKTPLAIFNDIGLLRLKWPVNLTLANAGTVCLPVTRSLQDMELARKRGVVAGLGISENGTRSNVIVRIEVPIFEKNDCRTLYDRRTITKSVKDQFGTAFCAGEFEEDSRACDSGSPLMIEASYKNQYDKMIQFGIVSYERIERGSHYPGVYTEVKNFMKWILDTIEP